MRTPLLMLVLGSALLATRASADSCVEIDEERDTLDERERAAARALFIQALESNGQRVARGGAECTAVYRVSNVRLGNSVTASVVAPSGSRTLSVRVIEDLPNVYDQMVRSLLSGDTISNSSNALTRTNVTANQAAPRRAEADSLWYARLGYGSTTGGTASGGPAMGFGYRYELDRIGVDLSFLNFAYATNETENGYGETETDADFSGSWLRLLAYYYASPEANSSLYVGAGLSWGGAAVSENYVIYSGSGIQGELSLGYELLRASTVRLFVQADATLPFYRSTADFGESRYTPTFVVSLGGGFGRGNTARVSIIP